MTVRSTPSKPSPTNEAWSPTSYVAGAEATFPDYPTRRKIEKAVAREVREHIIVYATHDKTRAILAMGET